MQLSQWKTTDGAKILRNNTIMSFVVELFKVALEVVIVVLLALHALFEMAGTPFYSLLIFIITAFVALKIPTSIIKTVHHYAMIDVTSAIVRGMEFRDKQKWNSLERKFTSGTNQ